MIPIVGFLPADDPRVLSTIQATAMHLTDQHGLVFRYISQDGLSGQEGSFLLCTFWLAQAQALAGQMDQAMATFTRAVSFANDVGLLSEEILPETKELLGNFSAGLQPHRISECSVGNRSASKTPMTKGFSR